MFDLNETAEAMIAGFRNMMETLAPDTVGIPICMVDDSWTDSDITALYWEMRKISEEYAPICGGLDKNNKRQNRMTVTSIFVLAGQSNAQWWGTTVALPAGFAPPPACVRHSRMVRSIRWATSIITGRRSDSATCWPRVRPMTRS